MLYEDKINKISVVITDKEMLLYSLIIPENLVKDFKTNKESVLLYHTEPKKKVKIRKQPDRKRIEKEIKKLLKER